MLEPRYNMGMNTSQPYLIPPVIDDLVDKDHPSNAVYEVCRMIFSTNSKNFNCTGRPTIPVTTLGFVVCWCLMNAINTFREMEDACRVRVDILAKCNGEPPDHGTLWLFTKSNQDDIAKCLEVVIRCCKDLRVSRIGSMSISSIRTENVALYCSRYVKKFLKDRRRVHNRRIDAAKFSEHATGLMGVV